MKWFWCVVLTSLLALLTGPTPPIAAFDRDRPREPPDIDDLAVW